MNPTVSDAPAYGRFSAPATAHTAVATDLRRLAEPLLQFWLAPILGRQVRLIREETKVRRATSSFIPSI